MNSIFEIFKIGIGPSSSHTVGPMKAAKKFRDELLNNKNINNEINIKITLYGSLAFTGKGHSTDTGIILGLSGITPETIDNKLKKITINRVLSKKEILLNNDFSIPFQIDKNILFDIKTKTNEYSNMMRFSAFNKNKNVLNRIYYSIGGGFIKQKNEIKNKEKNKFPYSFSSSKDLLKKCKKNKFKIHELMMKNESSLDSQKNTKNNILKFWSVMDDSIKNGIESKGILEGGLKLKRRANDIYKSLKKDRFKDPLKAMDWVSLYAIAVNEENASGGKVVTAPTNGAAGILPAVAKYYMQFTKNSNKNGIFRFFLTAGAIGILYKKNASISGAEVGCQGEVGVACSMAAAGLVAALNGNNNEIENAAEIAMEHNLGLTCDPVGGLVQIPCIERNAMGAVKAINAARLAMIGKGEHKVSLDDVIKTMMQTGKDMQTIYKETSNGGLAVNVTEC